jgi:hypothetical protein
VLKERVGGPRSGVAVTGDAGDPILFKEGGDRRRSFARAERRGALEHRVEHDGAVALEMSNSGGERIRAVAAGRVDKPEIAIPVHRRPHRDPHVNGGLKHLQRQERAFGIAPLCKPLAAGGDRVARHRIVDDMLR